VPVQVSGLTNVIAIASGGPFNMALKSDGTVWAWGYGPDGQLGNGVSSSSNTPVQVSGLSGVSVIACGAYHAMAIKNDGTLWTWGYNAYGQLGNGSTTSSNVPVQAIGLTGITAIAGGGSYSFARKSDGTLWSWGDESGGYLGNGVTGGYTTTPAQISGLSGVIDIRSRWNHSMCLKSDGTIWAWGLNRVGQFGNGTMTDSSSPVQVSNLSGVLAISVSLGYSTALRSDGSLWNWGTDNQDGPLALGGSLTQTSTFTSVLNLSGITAIAGSKSHYLAVKSDGTVWTWDDITPGSFSTISTNIGHGAVQISGLSGITAVSCGAYFNLALKSDGTVWSWGQNKDGQLGNGNNTDNQTPAQISGLSSITAVACGSYFGMALKSDGTVWTWGYNADGELGNGTTTSTNTPAQISSSSLSGIVALGPGSDHAMVVKSDGTVWVWGANRFGDLGTGSMSTGSTTPVQLSSLSGITMVIGGYFHSVALKNDGTVWAWGVNEDGELGNGGTTDSDVPVQVSGLSSITSIKTAIQAFHNVAVKSDGSVWTWGDNVSGQLGLGIYGPLAGTSTSPTGEKAPVKLPASSLASPTAVACGKYSTIALTSSGSVVECGDASYAPLGFSVPVQSQTPGLINISVVSGGGYHSLLLQSNGILWGWGDNAQGQLGNGTTVTQSSPIPVDISNVKAAAAGGYHSLAVKSDGTVWAWGDNSLGQIGDGTTIQRNAPVAISGLSGMLSVAAGYTHSLALKSDGTVWAWGYNGDGELGNGSNSTSLTPVQVSGLTGIKAIAVRGYQSMALRNDGTIWTWGLNSSGQLGNGSTTSSNVPVQVTGISSAISIAAGAYFSAAIESNGSVWMWGDNTYGQLGDGTTTNRTTAYQVQLSGSPLNNAVMLAAGDNHILVARADGTIVAFGANYSGQLGDGTTTNQYSPEVLSGFTKVGWVAAGGIDSYASANTVETVDETFESGLMSWGDNSLGQLGVGTMTGPNLGGATPALPNIPASPLSFSRRTIVSGGTTHTLVLKADGTVWEWGTLNLASGVTHIAIPTPVQVPNLTNIVSVSALEGACLALRNDGTVWTWGYNLSDQLGYDSTNMDTSVPHQVPGLSGIIGLSNGPNADSVFAMKNDGSVWMWGSNYNGQLGFHGLDDGEGWYVQTPGQFSSNGIAAVATGAEFTLILNQDGTVRGVGDNSYGELNTSGLTGIVAICVGYRHCLALKYDGTVWAWGSNGSGQLGNNTTITSTVPIQVTALSGIARISAGTDFSMAVTSSGTTYAWGLNASGQLGNGSTTDSHVPVSSSSLSGIYAISAGAKHSIAVKNDGSVWNWGYNADNELGNGTTTNNSTPATVSGINLNVIDRLVVGNSQSGAFRSDGTLWTWGTNAQGQLGIGNLTNSLLPVQNSYLTSVQSIGAGTSFTTAVKSDGTIWSWGLNSSGQLGNGTTANAITPVSITSLSGSVIQASTGSTHEILVKSDHTIWAFGANGSGQLGNNSTIGSSSPVQVNSVTLNGDAAAVAAGGLHSVALKRDGTIWTWGSNAYGQLGNGTTTDSHSPIQLTGLSGVFIGIAAGSNHTIALKSDGTVWTWGYNGDGELGNGTTTNSSTPIAVPGLNNVVAIGATASASYALTADGTLWSWGANSNGQLGIGSTTSSSIPVQVTGITQVVSLATGSSANHMLAAKTDGTVWGWGDNTNGDIGDGTTTQRTSPVQVSAFNLIQGPAVPSLTLSSSIFTAGSNISLNVVPGVGSDPTASVSFYNGSTLLGTTTASPFNFTWNNVSAGYYTLTVVATDVNGVSTSSSPVRIKVMRPGYDSVAASNYSSFALRSDGTVWAWGGNNTDALGVGGLMQQANPSWVEGMNNVVAISANTYHGAALTAAGQVWTWGDNASGDLGIGSTVAQSIPQLISTLGNVIQIGTGQQHGVALASDGTVWTWGRGNEGELGGGNNSSSNVPIHVNPALLNGVVMVGAGTFNTVALKGDGTVWTWGRGNEGELGNGTTSSSNVPVQVSGLSGIVSISVGDEFAAALKNDGTMWIWGLNASGQLGNGITTNSSTPIQVSALSGVASIQLGDSISSAILTSGAVYTWGLNSSGQLGLGSSTSTFKTPQLASKWATTIQFAFGLAHSIALTSSGAVWASGDDTYSELGNGLNSTTSTSPVQVQGLYGIIGLSAGDTFSLSVKNDGTVWGWGNNASGQLGNDSTTSSLNPVQASIINNAVQVSSGSGFSLALAADGTVWAWGANSYGQLGINTNITQVNFPAPVPGLTNIVQIAAGTAFGMALRSDGTVWTWGAGAQGQLGNGATSNSSVPVQVSGLTGVIQIAAGNQHALALISGMGQVKSWGSNSNGQLGNGNTTNSSVPVNAAPGNGWEFVAAGTNFSAAIQLSASTHLYAWGYNADGEIGNGTTTQSTTPTQVSSFTGSGSVINLIVGSSYVLAETNTGAIYGWGKNNLGQLGVGSTTNHTSPTQLTSLSTGVTVLGDGSSSNHSLVLYANQTLYGFGDNLNGDIGDGTTTQRTSPVVASSVIAALPTVAPTITLTEPDGATLLP